MIKSAICLEKCSSLGDQALEVVYKRSQNLIKETLKQPKVILDNGGFCKE